MTWEMNATYLMFAEWAYIAMFATLALPGRDQRKDDLALFGLICCILATASAL